MQNKNEAENENDQNHQSLLEIPKIQVSQVEMILLV
jgi:hypothetical protein